MDLVLNPSRPTDNDTNPINVMDAPPYRLLTHLSLVESETRHTVYHVPQIT